jgi:hypothetical protein
METSDRLERAKRWIDLIAGVAVIFTMVFIAFQSYEMHSGSVDTHDLAIAAKKQADAAKAQSDQAKAQTDKMAESLTKTDALIRQATKQSRASNELARDAAKMILVSERQARIAERAWIIAAQTDFAPFEIGKSVKILSESRNTGHTPAINAVISSHCDQWHKGETSPVLEQLTREKIAESTVRPEGGMRAFCNPFLITQTVINQLHSGDFFVRAHGQIWYDDVFGHHHWMTFCSEYDYEMDAFVGCDAGQYTDTDPE